MLRVTVRRETLRGSASVSSWREAIQRSHVLVTLTSPGRSRVGIENRATKIVGTTRPPTLVVRRLGYTLNLRAQLHERQDHAVTFTTQDLLKPRECKGKRPVNESPLFAINGSTWPETLCTPRRPVSRVSSKSRARQSAWMLAAHPPQSSRMKVTSSTT